MPLLWIYHCCVSEALFTKQLDDFVCLSWCFSRPLCFIVVAFRAVIVSIPNILTYINTIVWFPKHFCNKQLTFLKNSFNRISQTHFFVSKFFFICFREQNERGIDYTFDSCKVKNEFCHKAFSIDCRDLKCVAIINSSNSHVLCYFWEILDILLTPNWF